jgi:anti-sigma factor RsiW
MNCSLPLNRLHDYLDGGLTAPEASAVETHLRDCEQCRAELAFYRQLGAQAAALPKGRPPERDLWAGVERRIVRRGTRFNPRVLAAAAIALVVLSSAATALWMRRTAPSADNIAALQMRYTAATADLARRVADEDARLSPATRAIVRRNLQIIDAAIRESEDALARDPSNRGLELMLRTRYQQRLDLLLQARRFAEES